MALIVQKFGGTSVGSIDRIKHVAGLIQKEVDLNNQVVVVVSAMSGVTDQLVSYCSEISDLINDEELAEYDSVVSTGEQVTSGLMALALQKLGIKSRSLLGWQVPLRTNGQYSGALIEDIHSAKIHEILQNGEVAVIAGFQGVTIDDRVTTLGRGGSDTSAVAIATALKADRCDIYTDVDGVYTCDPRIVKRAQKLDRVSYDEMLEMASLGAKVLHARSVEMAMKNRIVLRVLSSFVDKEGTYIVNEDELMEERIITGITYNRNEARVTIRGLIDQIGTDAAIFNPIADSGINVDMIIKGASYGKDSPFKTDITFTIPKNEIGKVKKLMEEIKDKVKFDEFSINDNISKVSVIGVGMRSHSGVAREMFDILAERGINILSISTSEIKISVLMAEEYTELALRALHTAYSLDGKEEIL